ncbi:MAG TPA: RHS repeat-associated core domain-containing protein, partial [bacterium]|nr:RHS repeat-associated core domain-containing protein [bacterium]
SYYRLKEVKYDYPSSPQRTDTFFQDGVHNLEQSVENSTTWNWGVDKLNRLREKKNGSTLAVEYDYDARNNMIFEDHDGTANDRTYVYDDLNRLIEVKDGSSNTIVSYKYDAFNRRTIKTVGTTNYRYTYDDWNIAEIWTSSTSYTNIIDAGMENHIAIEVRNGSNYTTYFFLTDERGNVVALTDEDGTILERYRYRVYGEHEVINSCHTACETTYQSCFDACNEDPTCEADCLATKNTCDSNCAATDYAGNIHNFLWGGSLYEPETDLYWMRNRYYHLDMHRFINQDPIGIWGDANNLGNGFAYVAGMVIEASDPTGLEGCSYSPGTNSPYPMSDPSDRLEHAWDSIYNNPAYQEGVFGTTAEKLSQTQPVGSETKTDLETGNTHSTTYYSNGDYEYVETDSEGNLINGISGNSKTGNFIVYYKNEDGDVIAEVYEKGELVSTWVWDPEKKKWVKLENSGIPVDDFEDATQSFFANQLLKKMLKGEKKRFAEIMEEEGPFTEYIDENGKRVFIRNPYYRGKDPMKEVIWRHQNSDGTWGFVRNPFAPGGAPTWSNTYEKFQQSGFIQPEVDPYFK